MQTDRLRSQNVADSMQTDRLRLRSQNVANSVWKEMENGKREGEEPKRPPEPQKPHKPGAKSHKARIEKRKKIHPAKKIRKKNAFPLQLCAGLRSQYASFVGQHAVVRELSSSTSY